jgi:hypothetical protein
MAERALDYLAVSAAFMPLARHGCVAKVVVDESLCAQLFLDPEWVSANPQFVESLSRDLAEQSLPVRLVSDRIIIDVSANQTRSQVLELAATLQSQLSELGSHMELGATEHVVPTTKGGNDQELLRNVPPHHGT